MSRKIPIKEWIQRLEKVYNTEEYRKLYGHFHYDYSNVKETKTCFDKIEVKCIEHNHIFWVELNRHYRKLSGCKFCGLASKKINLAYTNEEVDQKLLKRNIKRLDNILGVKMPINWLCLKENCKYIWKTNPDHILNKGTGCPNCNNVACLTNKIVDQRLKEQDRNYTIKRIDDVVNSTTKIKWLCLNNKCEYLWYATPNNILNNKTNCPKCTNQIPLTNEIIDQRLKDQNRDYLIKRDSEILGGHKSNWWKCLIEDCGYRWFTTPSSVISGNRSGCPQCNLSKGALEVTKVLKTLPKFKYNIEYWFDDLVNPKTNGYLYFDFVVYDDSGEIVCLIEYQGEQHYIPMRYDPFSKCSYTEKYAITKLQEQQYRDQLKRDYCQKNSLKLIEIPYWEFEAGNLENFLMERLKIS